LTKFCIKMFQSLVTESCCCCTKDRIVFDLWLLLQNVMSDLHKICYRAEVALLTQENVQPQGYKTE